MALLRIENHLSKLGIFLKVVETGSLRSGAKELGLPQPTVSRTMSGDRVDYILSEARLRLGSRNLERRPGFWILCS